MAYKEAHEAPVGADSNPDRGERVVDNTQRKVDDRHGESEPATSVRDREGSDVHSDDPEVDSEVRETVHALLLFSSVLQQSFEGRDGRTMSRIPMNQRRRCLRKSRNVVGLCSRTMPWMRPEVNPRLQASWENSKSSASEPKSHVHSFSISPFVMRNEPCTPNTGRWMTEFWKWNRARSSPTRMPSATVKYQFSQNPSPL